jgi:hypothetical protein
MPQDLVFKTNTIAGQVATMVFRVLETFIVSTQRLNYGKLPLPFQMEKTVNTPQGSHTMDWATFFVETIAVEVF